MSKSSLFYLTLILLYLLPTLTISTPHHHHHHHHHDNHHGSKSMHLTLYQHDTINKTDFIIVKGVVGPSIAELTSPFGTIVVLKDNLTTTPNPSSKVLGNVEGIAITSSFDGLDGFSVGRVKLELENGLKGSISVVGVINALEPSDYPVVGGTKDFLFVQGYVSLSLVSFKGASYVYRHDFHLFWPPYASKAISMLATNGSSIHG
ncbi:hypothetical protein RND81_04G182700 [Saponaria officinalis]|uniref:Dirigent protein n=1 Tax=Saponaria officinalis TaxID=3572 RepID=A0AAW1LNF8_SAPOF